MGDEAGGACNARACCCQRARANPAGHNAASFFHSARATRVCDNTVFLPGDAEPAKGICRVPLDRTIIVGTLPTHTPHAPLAHRMAMLARRPEHSSMSATYCAGPMAAAAASLLMFDVEASSKRQGGAIAASNVEANADAIARAACVGGLRGPAGSREGQALGAKDRQAPGGRAGARGVLLVAAAGLPKSGKLKIRRISRYSRRRRRKGGSPRGDSQRGCPARGPHSFRPDARLLADPTSRVTVQLRARDARVHEGARPARPLRSSTPPIQSTTHPAVPLYHAPTVLVSP